MTTTARARIPAALGIVLGGALLAAGCSIEPDAPDKPTYEADVRPIFMARCVRCHGSPPMGDATSTNVIYRVAPTVPAFRLDVYADADPASCPVGAMVGTVDCLAGAKSYALLIPAYIGLSQNNRMPPDPAPALTKYQIDTISAWAADPALPEN